MHKIACLHSHTYYSDGICSPSEFASLASPLAITDHGTLAAHWFTCSESHIVRGIELYVDLPEHLATEKRRTRSACHLTLLADGEAGWRELVALNRLAWEGFYYVPRLRLDDVYGDHLIVLSGCPASPIAKLFFSGRLDDAERVYLMLAERFKGRFFAEVQSGTPLQESYSAFILELAARYGHTVVYTQDAHYTLESYKTWCVSRHGFDCDAIALDKPIPGEHYVYYENARQLGLDIRPFSITGSYIPEQTDESIAYIRRRIEETPFALSEDDKRRIDYEISVMVRCGVMGYMMLADKIVSIAKRVAGRAVVRGSAASSLVAYCLGWSEFHPDRYGLIFERFLSPQRRELPDVDIDVPSSKRDDVIAELSKHYSLSYIATELAYAEKSAANQVERYKRGAAGHVLSDDELEQCQRALIGRLYGIGIHASGLAVIPESLRDIIPIKVVDGKPVCEWSMERLPTVKIDLLGQKTLDIIAACRVPSVASLPDREMIDSVSSSTIGIFQLEGAMRDFARWCLRHGYPVPYIISMYRPAVIDSGLLLKACCGDDMGIPSNERVVCRHGFPVYQEDLLRILSVNGVPLEHSYTILKLTAKKDRESVLAYLRKHGFSLADRVIALCESFAGYSFNMAHAAAYAQRAWQVAWARLYRPHIFWPAMIDSEDDDVMRAAYVMAASRIFRILPPDGRSMSSRVEGENLILGLCNLVGYSKHGVLLDGDGKDAVESMMKRSNKRNRDVIMASGLYRYWLGEGCDIITLRKYLRVPCPLDLRGARGETLASLLDRAYDAIFSGKHDVRVVGSVVVFGDGERVTDGTSIVYLKTRAYELVKCNIVIVRSKRRPMSVSCYTYDRKL